MHNTIPQPACDMSAKGNARGHSNRRMGRDRATARERVYRPWSQPVVTSWEHLFWLVKRAAEHYGPVSGWPVAPEPCEMVLTGAANTLVVRCRCMAGTVFPGASRRFYGYDPNGEASDLDQAKEMWRAHRQAVLAAAGSQEPEGFRPMDTSDIDPETGEGWGVGPEADESQVPPLPGSPGASKPGVPCCGPTESGEQS